VSPEPLAKESRGITSDAVSLCRCVAVSLCCAMPCGVTLQYVNYLSWKRRLMMLHDVASGMMFMHSRRYVHGDLRSPNLFITENGRVSGTRQNICVCGDVGREVIRLTHFQGQSQGQGPYLLLYTVHTWGASRGL
jgi:serine/threonine protein kinase